MADPTGNTPTGALQYWQAMQQQAETGEFRMEEELGTALRGHLATLIGELDEMLRNARRLGRLSGFGGLASAQALQRKFELKADGGENGDSAVNRLEEAIDIAKAMDETFRIAIQKAQETDWAVSSALGNTGM